MLIRCRLVVQIYFDNILLLCYITIDCGNCFGGLAKLVQVWLSSS